MANGPVILAQLPSSAVTIGPAPDYNLIVVTDGQVIGFPVWDVDHRTIYGWQTADGKKFAGFATGFGGYDASKPPPNYDPEAWRATQDDINRGADVWVDATGYTHWGYSDCCNPAPSFAAWYAEAKRTNRARLYSNTSVTLAIRALGINGLEEAITSLNWPKADALLATGPAPTLGPAIPTNDSGGGFSTPTSLVTVAPPPPPGTQTIGGSIPLAPTQTALPGAPTATPTPTAPVATPVSVVPSGPGGGPGVVASADVGAVSAPPLAGGAPPVLAPPVASENVPTSIIARVPWYVWAIGIIGAVVLLARES